MVPNVFAFRIEISGEKRKNFLHLILKHIFGWMPACSMETFMESAGFLYRYLDGSN